MRELIPVFLTRGDYSRSISTPPWTGCWCIAGLPPAFNLPVPIYRPAVGEERHCESTVSCPRTQHCTYPWPELKPRPLCLASSSLTMGPQYLPPKLRLVQFWENFQTTFVIKILYCTHIHTITNWPWYNAHKSISKRQREKVLHFSIFHTLTLNSPIVISKDFVLGVPEGSDTVTKAVM